MMKRRVFGMLLSLCLVLMLIPAAGSADGEITINVPYTIEVKSTSNPGEAKFCLEPISASGEQWDGADDVSISSPLAALKSDGSYSGMLTIAGTAEGLNSLSGGVFVQQVADQRWQNGDGWTYDDTVWLVRIIKNESGDGITYDFAICPTGYDSKKGVYEPLEDQEVKLMTFTNTYAKPGTETSNPNATPVPDTSSLPRTGDSSHLTGWLALLSACCAGVWFVNRRRG